MASRAVSVSLPEPLWEAVYAEASRRCEAPATVVRDVLIEALPGVVANALRRDLAPVVRTRSREVTVRKDDDQRGEPLAVNAAASLTSLAPTISPAPDIGAGGGP